MQDQSEILQVRFCSCGEGWSTPTSHASNHKTITPQCYKQLQMSTADFPTMTGMNLQCKIF